MEHLLFLVVFFRFKLKIKIRMKRERPTSDDFAEMRLMRMNDSVSCLSEISSRLVEELVLLRKTYLSKPVSSKLKGFSFFNGLT